MSGNGWIVDSWRVFASVELSANCLSSIFSVILIIFEQELIRRSFYLHWFLEVNLFNLLRRIRPLRTVPTN